MFITGVGIAVPPGRHTQEACLDATRKSPQYARLKPRSRALLEKVMRDTSGIATRHLSLDPIEEFYNDTPDALQARFTRHAPALAAQSARNALAAALCAPHEIDALLISTCTGYLCPGLTSYVAPLLGLRADVMALDLVGQGCGAALPNLRTAAALIGSGACGRALSICVEVCSAAFYLDDDPGVLISACLFGDGAGAAVLSREPLPDGRRLEWLDCRSVMDPSHLDTLRFEHRGGKLRNRLGAQVPALAAQYARQVLDQTLSEHALTQDKIGAWIWHAGGRDVLIAIRDTLSLNKEDLRWSVDVLRDIGNISSGFVLHVLHRVLRENAPGGHWWMSSFGAGFSCHGALLHAGPPSAGSSLVYPLS